MLYLFTHNPKSAISNFSHTLKMCYTFSYTIYSLLYTTVYMHIPSHSHIVYFTFFSASQCLLCTFSHTAHCLTSHLQPFCYNYSQNGHYTLLRTYSTTGHNMLLTDHLSPSICHYTFSHTIRYLLCVPYSTNAVRPTYMLLLQQRPLFEVSCNLITFHEIYCCFFYLLQRKHSCWPFPSSFGCIIISNSIVDN
jgi:hypothetical protein